MFSVYGIKTKLLLCFCSLPKEPLEESRAGLGQAVERDYTSQRRLLEPGPD